MELNCDHICLLGDGHVEQGTLHFYGYELPSSRKLALERLRLTESCGTCGGSGFDFGLEPCPSCDARGWVFPAGLIEKVAAAAYYSTYPGTDESWEFIAEEEPTMADLFRNEARAMLAAVVSYMEEGK